MDHLTTQAEELLAKIRRKSRKRHRMVSALAAVVVFCTVYMLILPAITMTKQTVCGYEEHTHGESCYSDQAVRICGLEDHVHSEACYGETQALICTMEESPGHKHRETCYQEVRKLTCELNETEGHAHSETCYVTKNVPICGQEESEGHIHSDSCYVMRETPICGKTEAEGHSHDLSCYTEIRELTCGLDQDETHTHSETCYTTRLELSCGKEERAGHIHTAECFRELACGRRESQGHTHSEACFQQVRELACGREETGGHVHGDECYSVTRQLCCGEEESEGHTHGEGCYEAKRVLLCDQEEHTHIETCTEIRQILTCTIPEHVHTTDCYEEHPDTTPTEAPGDPTADLETSQTWEASMAEVELTGIWSTDVLAIAESQQGYRESVRNYIVDADGSRKGYTRYGAWYGAPYEDWCAMFVSFCLNYAGVKDFPLEASTVRWIALLEKEPLDAWEPPGGYTPKPGDLIFFDRDLDGISDHVGLVVRLDREDAEKQEPTIVRTIEGNTMDAVATRKYSIKDERILGYGVLPQNPEGPNGEGELTRGTADEILAAGDYRVWFDGTEGLGTTLNYYQGATNTSAIAYGGKVTLPASAGTPANGCVLNGWYDVNTGTYYGKDQLGTQITVSRDTVFYADWVPANDDYLNSGRTTVQSADTAGFVRSELFDYNELVNMLSASMSNSSVSNTGHNETWRLDPNKPFNFTFYQWAYNNIKNGSIGALNNLNERNQYNGEANDRRVIAGIVTSESDQILQTLFTDSGTPGVRKVGEGPGLFQFNASTGYYYYDSKKNGAAYQASEGRFYVYSNPTKIQKQSKNFYGNGWTNGTSTSDAFMPLNRESTVPEKNGNGNFWFGMKTTIDFFLPEKPGSNGGNCNYSATGDPMVFRFSGDDDVWVFVDGVPVLDLGGIHGVVDGSVDFSKGIVTYTDYNGQTRTKSLPDSILEGEHKLTMYYLERGSSESNCSIYFNIAPRYGLDLTKKDRETQNLLNGAEFSVYMNQACTVPTQLWDSKAAFEAGQTAKNTFTVENGHLSCYGLSPGRTYYIKETKAPDSGYPEVSDTTIALTLNSRGEPSVQVLNPSEAIGVTDVSRDSEIQRVSMTVDNKKPGTTSIKAEKVWLDAEGNPTEAGTPFQLQLWYSKIQMVVPSGTHRVRVTTQHFSADGLGGGNQDTLNTIPADYTYTMEVQNGSDLAMTLNSLTARAGFYSVTVNGEAVTPQNAVYGTENCYIGGRWNQHPIASAVYNIPDITEDQDVVITLIGWPAWENGKVVMAKTMSASYAETTHAAPTPTPEIPSQIPEGAEKYGSPVTVYPDENGRWSYEWTDLPFSENGEAYYYYVEELPLDGYETSYSGNGAQSGTITVTNRESGENGIRLRLLKVSSESGNPLSGAAFDLYRPAGDGESGMSLPALEGNWIRVNGAPLITGQDGRVSIGGLEEGVYYLVETAAPTGFVLDPTPHRIELTATSAGTDPEDEAVLGSASSTAVTVRDTPKNADGDLVVEKRWYVELEDGTGRVPAEPSADEIRYQIHRSYEQSAEGVPFRIACKDMTEPGGTTILQGTAAPGTTFRFYAYGLWGNGSPDSSWNPVLSCSGGTLRKTTQTVPTDWSWFQAPVYELTIPATASEVEAVLDSTGQNSQKWYASYRAGYLDGAGPVAPVGGGGTVEELVTVTVGGVPTDTFTLSEANGWLQSFQRSQLNENPDVAYTYWVEELDVPEGCTVAYQTEHNSENPDQLYLVIENTHEPPEPEPPAPSLHKSIDFLGDGGENPDTARTGGTCYRLYLRAEIEDWTKRNYLSEITDQLSPYVQYDTAQPDEKVVWTDDQGRTHVVWENGQSTAANRDSAGNQIVQGVLYDPAQAENSTGTVRMILNPECELTGTSSFELSFNVELTELAMQTYLSSGYNAVGDPNTDYGTNATSSDQDGFRSNHRALLTWYGNGTPCETDYEHPVVQIQKPRLLLQKVSAVDGSVLEGASFDLYAACGSEEEGAVLIPGVAGCFGRKCNEEPLITDETGRIPAMELEPGSYYLVETSAPAGYYASAKPAAFTVGEDGLVVSSEASFTSNASAGDPLEDGTLVLRIANKTAIFIPETGSTGTLWYIIGGLLLALAALMCTYKILRERGNPDKTH